MLLYLQPLNDGEQRRCFVSEPPGQGGDFSELHTDSASASPEAENAVSPLCVHLSPTVTSIYLARE